MKAMLLNDGGFGGAENVKFPVEVEVHRHVLSNGLYHPCVLVVHSSELVRVGFSDIQVPNFLFRLGTECEVIDETHQDARV